MKKIALILGLLPLTAFAETDAQIALNNAISSVRTNCSGISSRMETIKKMAGIGTAINAVGTASGIGGVVAGAVKYKKDKEIAKAVIEKSGVDLLLEKLKNKGKESTANQTNLAAVKKLDKDIEKRIAELESGKTEEELRKKSADLQSEIKKNQEASTLAGNVRTGMFAVDTVTNVAGAVTSSKTIADDDFIDRIKKCTESIDALRTARARSKFEDGETVNVQNMNLSQKLIEKCGEYEYVNFTPLNNFGKGAMIANSVGAATGTVATITSAIGNKNKVSDTNILAEKEKQKNQSINMASNVMGGVTATASLAGTVLNASQIKTAKQVLDIAQECEEALK